MFDKTWGRGGSSGEKLLQVTSHNLPWPTHLHVDAAGVGSHGCAFKTESGMPRLALGLGLGEDEGDSKRFDGWWSMMFQPFPQPTQHTATQGTPWEENFIRRRSPVPRGQPRPLDSWFVRRDHV